MPFARSADLTERRGINAANVTGASGSVIAAPAFLYKVVISLTNTVTSGLVYLLDATASGNNSFLKVKMAADASGSSENTRDISFNPPVLLRNGLYISATAVDTNAFYDDAY